MKFQCAACQEISDQSLLNQLELKMYRKNEVGISFLRCPFCHAHELRVLE